MTDEPPTKSPVPASQLPLAAAVQSAFDVFDQAVASLEHIAPSFATARQPVRTLNWPTPGPPRPDTTSRSLPPVPECPPKRVWTEWKADGPVWLAGASRRQVRAALVALSDDTVGPRLATDARFLSGLTLRLRARQQQRALTTALFRVYPPAPAVLAALPTAKDDSEAPPWWSSRDSMPSMLQVLSNAVAAGELRQPGDLGVPEVAWRTGWAEAIISARGPKSMEDVRATLAFAWAGQTVTVGVLNAARTQAIAGGIEHALKNRSCRREMARLAASHVGTPFGPDAEARWRPLGDGLKRVRQWLAGEIIKIVFQHLKPPDPDLAHMARPRREYWSQYTGSVRRIWVVVTRAIRPQLSHPDVVRLDDTMGDDFVVCDLEGGPEQAVVWMQLDGPRGPVTVIEGNANTSIRIREGAFEPKPPPRRWRLHSRRVQVDYTYDIVRGAFTKSKAWVRPHLGQWQDRVTNQLLQHGIRKDK